MINKKIILYSLALNFIFAINFIRSQETPQNKLPLINNNKETTKKSLDLYNLHLKSSPSAKKYSLPGLPYAYDALNPYIDTETMHLHHDKHHKSYVDKLNKTLEKNPKYFNYSLEYLLKNLSNLPRNIKNGVKKYGGGHYNHSLFWNVMSPYKKLEPSGNLKNAINKTFGSFKEFKNKFSQTAKNVFGSGYAWLSLDKNNNLVIHQTKNQDTPFALGFTPLLLLDVWEHAYYLKYHNNRSNFIKNWWNIVNWSFIEQLYDKASQEKLNKVL